MNQSAESSVDIASLLNRRFVRIAQGIPRVTGIFVILVGLGVLVGWKFDIAALKSVEAGWENMPPNMAITLVLSGVAILFQYRNHASALQKILGKLTGVLVALLGFLTLIEYLFSWDIHIDYLLFASEIDRAGLPFHGRMSPLSAVISLLVGLALTNLDSKKPSKHPLSHFIAFTVALAAMIPLIGYLFGTPFYIGVGAYSDMAIHTAFSFLALSLAILFCRIDHDLPAVIVSDGPGGFAARRLVFTTVPLLLFLGWFRVVAERHHLLSSSFGTATFTAIAIGIIVLLIWQQSASLQRMEIVRRQTAEERDRLHIEGELRTQFVSMISHDLRTPLTTANARAQLIMKRAKTIEECKASAEVLLSSLNRLDGMILDLLDSSRVRAGRAIPLEIKECDVSQIVSSVLRELSFVHGDRFVEKIDSSASAYCDQGTIRRVLENLCSNAVKYGKSGTKIGVSVSAFSEFVRLSVHNSGDPISREDQEKLFAPFERTRKGETSGKEGWGLGLALVHAIIEAHHGKVWVESSEEEGTTFIVEIPRTRQK